METRTPSGALMPPCLCPLWCSPQVSVLAICLFRSLPWDSLCELAQTRQNTFAEAPQQGGLNEEITRGPAPLHCPELTAPVLGTQQ